MWIGPAALSKYLITFPFCHFVPHFHFGLLFNSIQCWNEHFCFIAKKICYKCIELVENCWKHEAKSTRSIVLLCENAKNFEGPRRPIKMTTFLLHACTIMQNYIIAFYLPVDGATKCLCLIQLKRMYMFVCTRGLYQIRIKNFFIFGVVDDSLPNTCFNTMQTI